MPGLDDCYPWQPGGCEWTVPVLWPWMSRFGRFDVYVLALMLVYTFAVVVHVCTRCYLARRAPGIDSARKRTFIAVLNVEVGSLKSVAITAPYLGLAGTCVGILDAFTPAGFWTRIQMGMAVALIPTAAAIPVAVLATAFHSYLCTRIGLLESEVLSESWQSSLHFRGASRLTATKRLPELPAFGLLAVSVLALAIAGFGLLPPFRSRGIYVETASARCEQDGDDRLIVLRVTDGDKVFLNFEREDWNSLPGRLSQIYGMREYRTLFLLADSDVSFQTVAHALDSVEHAGVNIKVRLITPKALDADCLARPVPVISFKGSRAAR